MPSNGGHRAQGKRVIVHKANPKTPSKDQDGTDFQESEDDTVDGDVDVEGEDVVDPVSILNQIRDIQKQIRDIQKTFCKLALSVRMSV